MLSRNFWYITGFTIGYAVRLLFCFGVIYSGFWCADHFGAIG